LLLNQVKAISGRKPKTTRTKSPKTKQPQATTNNLAAQLAQHYSISSTSYQSDI